MTNSHYIINETDKLNDLRASDVLESIRHFDYPYFDPNLVQNWLYRCIHENGYKFVIDGHGADELLSGYQWHLPHITYSALAELKFSDAFSVANYFYNSYPDNYSALYKTAVFGRGIFNSLKLSENTKYFGSVPERHSRIRYKEIFSRVLLRLLNNYDMTSMKNSVEVRTPFMDHRLVANILSQPNSFFCGKLNKPWLRRIISENSGIDIMSKKIGLRTYLWNNLPKTEIDYLYDIYLNSYKEIGKIFDRSKYHVPIRRDDIENLTPSKEHQFWKILSFSIIGEIK